MGEPYDLVAALRPFDADVLVLQEVWRPREGAAQVDTLAAERGMAIYEVVLGVATTRARWPHMVADGHGTVSTAILTALPLEQIGKPKLGPVPGDPSPGRRALHVRVDLEGTPLDIVGVHLTSRLPHGPPLQLRNLARQLPTNDAPAVVAGDCNFWGPPAQALIGRGWRRAVRGRTWPAASPHSQIDHVFVTESITVLSGEVLPDVGSDHRPVRVTLALD